MLPLCIFECRAKIVFHKIMEFNWIFPKCIQLEKVKWSKVHFSKIGIVQYQWKKNISLDKIKIQGKMKKRRVHISRIKTYLHETKMWDTNRPLDHIKVCNTCYSDFQHCCDVIRFSINFTDFFRNWKSDQKFLNTKKTSEDPHLDVCLPICQCMHTYTQIIYYANFWYFPMTILYPKV